MSSTFTVSTDASSTALTTRDAVKTALGITSNDEDAYIDSLLPRVTDIICSYLNIARAEDGTRTLGRETLVETFRLQRADTRLLLSRTPVISISSITEDGTAVDSADYEFEAVNGAVSRLSSDLPYAWLYTDYKTVVTYVAGWLLPGDSGRDLPYDIEDAAIGLIKANMSARTRDPAVKREDVYQVGSTDYWVGAIGGGSLPPEITAKLDPYREIEV